MNNIKAIKCYYNFYNDKSQIYKDNKNKAGVYCLENIITNEIYVGCSVNLTKRFYNYFSNSNLEFEKINSNSRINRAISKYKHSNFKLYILKYCDQRETIK